MRSIVAAFFSPRSDLVILRVNLICTGSLARSL
jgi:hypothetical protein